MLYPRLEAIKLNLSANTIIQKDLHEIMLKYFKASVKIENKYNEIKYFTQDQFKDKNFRGTFVKNVYICGILELKNPIEKFAYSTIHSINGHVILSGYVNTMFYKTSFLDKNFSKFDISEASDIKYIFKDIWKSFKDLKEEYKDLKTAGICMYAPPRCPYEGKICGKIAIPLYSLNQRVFARRKYLDARCQTCAGKIGIIQKLMRSQKLNRFSM